MENPTYVDDENIPYIHDEVVYDDDDDIYNNSRAYTPVNDELNETPFTTPLSDHDQQVSSAMLSKEVLKDKIQSLYTTLMVDGNVDLVDLDRFKLVRNSKTGFTELKFFNGEEWVRLTNKRTGEFLSQSTLKKAFGGINAMTTILSLEDVPPELNRSINAAMKLKAKLPTAREIEEIPLQDLARSVEDIHIATREAAQNTDLDMREMLGLDKALQRIRGEVLNNISKLSELDRGIKRQHEKLDELANSTEYTEEQRTEVQNRLKDFKEERKARLEVLSHNRKDLQSQVARIKQTIEKVLDPDTSLGEKLRTLFREQGITIGAIFIALGMIISTIVLAVTGGGGGGGSGGSTPPKDTNKFKEWIKDKLERLADALKRLAGKAVAALPGLIGSVIGAILNFLSKAVGFAAQHVWAVIVVVAGLIGAWLLNYLNATSSSKKIRRKKK